MFSRMVKEKTNPSEAFLSAFFSERIFPLQIMCLTAILRCALIWLDRGLIMGFFSRCERLFDVRAGLTSMRIVGRWLAGVGAVQV